MFYLIPTWKRDTLALDYDAILNYALMLEENDEPYVLVTDTFLPMFMYQLNQFNLLNAPVFQAFDVIQGVQPRLGKPLALEDLPELNHLDRIYSPQGVLLVQGRQRVATARMFADQFLQQLTYYHGDQRQVDDFDARGFLARRRQYQGHALQTEILFDPTGTPVLTVDQTEAGRVSINPDCHRFKHASYASLDELVTEVMERYLDQQPHSVNLVAAFARENMAITKQLQRHYRTGIVINQDDYRDQKLMHAAFQLRSPLLLPSSNVADQVRQLGRHHNAALHVVSPYTTQLELGNSNSNDTQIIFWHVSTMHATRFKRLATGLIELVLAAEDKELMIDTHSEALYGLAQTTIKRQVEAYFQISMTSEAFRWVQRYLRKKAKHQITPPLAKEAKLRKQRPDWKRLVRACETLDRLHVQGNSSVAFYNQIFDRLRILVDLEIVPNNYLQVKAINAGIPQINQVRTQFVKNQQNGVVVKKDDEVVLAVQAFLDSLQRWNQALVENVKEISAFSGTANIEKLQEIFKGMGS
ncbi:accessory Sec system protein Asp1 [Fructilactobacillus ixorae]|uniref:Accessory Sec system protein Asp1 n=1 Tax=Fructilactobacillus ixorae TaxID=1750535 RepID=A0ABY5C368_9LACO|nr:accessory Sec system protein Asp1 [Fructilactobacillus ixorae]USS93204.1 accessory Sec system protein Asp1 [Fructilactobacillus ixorae]